MAKESRAKLKSYFQTGDQPTETHFSNWFDSTVMTSGSNSITGSLIISGSPNDNADGTPVMLHVMGNITSSGNISASGTIYADNFQSTGGDVAGINFTDDLAITGHITSSGNISSSGNIIGHSGSFDNVTIFNINSLIPAEARLKLGRREGEHLHLGVNDNNGQIALVQDELGSNHTMKLAVWSDTSASKEIKFQHANVTGSSESTFAKFWASGSLGNSGSGFEIYVPITASGNISSSGVGSFSGIKITGNYDFKDGASNIEGFNYHSGKIHSNQPFNIVGNLTTEGNTTVTGEISSSGAINTLSHITASGNISSSGDIFANSIKLANGSGIAYADEIEGPSLSLDSTGQVRVDSAGSTINFSRNNTDAYVINPTNNSHNFTGHITASGNISASGEITSDRLKVLGTVPSVITSGLTIGSNSPANVNLLVDGNSRFESHITASGNISSSGTGSFRQLIVDDGHINGGLEISTNNVGSYIKDTGGGFLFIQASDSLILESAVGENYFKGNKDGSVQLYYDNLEKLATAAGGVSITGEVTASGNISSSITSTGSFGRVESTTFSATTLTATHGEFSTINTTQITSSIVTASVVYSSGSNIFGDESTDTHTFNGHITSSGNISSSGTGDNYFGGKINLWSAVASDQKITFGHSTQKIQGSDNYMYVDGDDKLSLEADIGVYVSSSATGIGNFILGNSTPAAVLHVSGTTATDTTFKVEGSDGTDYLTVGLGGHITSSGNISSSGDLIANNATISEGYLTVDGAGTSHGFELKRDSSDTYRIRHLDGGLTVYNSSDSRKEMTFDGTGNISASGNLTINQITSSGHISSSGTVTGNSIVASSLVVTPAIANTNNDPIISVNTPAGIDVIGPIDADGHITASGNISSSGAIYSTNHEAIWQGSAFVDADNASNWFGPNKNGLYNNLWNVDYGDNGDVVNLEEEYGVAGIIVPYKCKLVGFRAIASSITSGHTVELALYYEPYNSVTFNNTSGNASNATIASVVAESSEAPGAAENPMHWSKLTATQIMEANSMLYPRIKCAGTSGANITFTVLVQRLK